MKKTPFHIETVQSAPITSGLFLEKGGLVADLINHFARKILTSDTVELKEMKQEIPDGIENLLLLSD